MDKYIENIIIPINVKKTAKLANRLVKLGFKGGTDTGKNRGKQLANSEIISAQTLLEMRTWFSRHGPDAKNGGTSYNGYKQWINNNKPMTIVNKDNYAGAVSWMLWGGDEAYLWLKSKSIRLLLKQTFPKNKEASIVNNL
jgi:hypothetical protein